VTSEVADYYAISVTGLPMMAASNKESTQLQRKGRYPIYPARVATPEGEGSMILFFPRHDQPIKPEDKEVVFLTRMRPLQLEVKFNLKEMIYHGQLEVYRKNLTGLSEIESLNRRRPVNLAFESLFHSGSGRAEGIEVTGQKKAGSNTGWLRAADHPADYQRKRFRTGCPGSRVLHATRQPVRRNECLSKNQKLGRG
jgi:hypothetical protein